MLKKTFHGHGASLSLTVKADNLWRLRIFGLPLWAALILQFWRLRLRGGWLTVLPICNAYVRSGLRNIQQKCFLGTGTTVAGIGVSGDSAAVTIDTRFLNGASAGKNGAVAGQTVAIKAFSPSPSLIADGAGVAQTCTQGATFTNSDFNGGVPFIWKKLGMVLAVPASAALEVDGNLVDVIGGTGGTSPYNRTFSMDLTAVGNFTVVAQIADTPSAL